MINVGTIPENFSFTDVYTFHVATLPSLLVARRAAADELIWDAEGGFTDQWNDRSSVEGNPTDGYDFHIARRSFSVAGLPIFAAGTGGGGGGPTELAGDANGPSDANTVSGLIGIPIEADGLPSVGEVLTVTQAGDQLRLTFEESEGGGGSTDDIENTSTVAGATATDALNELDTRVTALEAAPGGGSSDDITNASSVPGATVTDALEALAVAQGSEWFPGLDVDFTTLANQTIVDGPAVIDGVTWTALGIATYSNQFAIVNGAGLTMKTNAVSSGMYNNLPPGMPLIKIKLVDICPGISLKSKIRVTVAIDQTGASAAAEVATCSLGSWTPSATDMSIVRIVPGYISAPNQNRIDAWRTSTYVDVDETTIPNTNDQIQIVLDSIENWVGTFLSAPYTFSSSPVVWKLAKDFVYARGFNFQRKVEAGFGFTGNGFTQLDVRNSPVLKDINEMAITLGAANNNTLNNTSFTAFIRALRIEYTK